MALLRTPEMRSVSLGFCCWSRTAIGIEFGEVAEDRAHLERRGGLDRGVELDGGLRAGRHDGVLGEGVGGGHAERGGKQQTERTRAHALGGGCGWRLGLVVCRHEAITESRTGRPYRLKAG